MPDLTRCFAWTCCTNIWWQTRVNGSKGEVYDVRFEHMPPSHDVQYDYTCTCKAYQYGGGKYCKHILAVRDGGQRCGWNCQLEPTAQALTLEDGHKVCPKCRGPIESIQVAV